MTSNTNEKIRSIFEFVSASQEKISRVSNTKEERRKGIIAMIKEATPAQEKEENDADVIDIEAKETITYDDFSKLQLQVGEIIACEEVPKSKKLLCSKVKIGSNVRQILSGIKAAGHFRTAYTRYTVCR